MQSNTISQYLNLVNLQIAAEAFLVVDETGVLKENLFGALADGNKHASRFTSTDAADFLNKFEIIAQKPNTSTGFSGTLFRAKVDDPQSGLKAGQYFLSFRSTEFVDDCIRDSEGTNQGIRDNGWAFGQICDMEDWYKELKNDLPSDVDLTVIGYSLGGHLADAFRQLRLEANEPDIKTYSINGAGTGKIENGCTLTDALDMFRSVWTTGQIPLFAPDNSIINGATLQARAEARAQALRERSEEISQFSPSDDPCRHPDIPENNAFLDYKIHLAQYVAGFWTVAAGTPSNPIPAIPRVGDPIFSNLTDLYGSGPVFVAGSGIHHTNDRQEIFIEDQPLGRGTALGNPSVIYTLTNNWDINGGGDTHSIILIQDSLSLMDTFARLDANVTLAQMNHIFNAATNREADSSSDNNNQGWCEGDTLETVLDALHKLVCGTDSKLRETDKLNEGGTWANIDHREEFHKTLKEINAELECIDVNGLSVKDLSTMGIDALQKAALEAEGTAYRYALQELNPFAITGLDYNAHNTQGELNLYVPGADNGVTEQWIQDRAAMLYWKMQFDTQNESYDNRLDASILDDWAYTDLTTGTNFKLDGWNLTTTADRRVIFGTDGDDPASSLQGDILDDRIYGGGGDDTLEGDAGANYLEGGKGVDTYLVSRDGKLDTIRDIDGKGSIRLDGLLLTGGSAVSYDTNAQPNSCRNSDNSLTYRQDGNDLCVIKDGHAEIRILNFDFANGALGITLEMEAAPVSPTPQTLNPANYHAVYLSQAARSVSTGSHADYVQGSEWDDYIELGGGSDYALGSTGNDVIFGQEGKDYINVGPIAGALPDDDIAVGGADRDVIRGGGGHDILHGGDIGDHALATAADSANFGDWLNGNEGDDELYGSRNSDLLQGGAGGDVIRGGAGNDVILGDGDLAQMVRFTALGAASSTFEWRDPGNSGTLTGHFNADISITQAFYLTDWSINYSGGRQDFTLQLGSGQTWLSTERSVVEAQAGDDVRRWIPPASRRCLHKQLYAY